MKLRLDPTSILNTWKTFVDKPFGKQLVSRAIGLMAPYTGTISPQVVDIAPGYAKVQMRDRWGVRNHLKSLHAVALMNPGEASTGLPVNGPVPPGDHSPVAGSGDRRFFRPGQPERDPAIKSIGEAGFEHAGSGGL